MYSLLENDEILGIRTFNDFIDEERRRRNKGRLVKSAINMYNGDMWDAGRGYIGPMPVKGDDDASKILVGIKRAFTGRNVIAEVVDRAVDGLLSRSPNWIIYNVKDIANNPRIKATPKALPEATFDSDGKRVDRALTRRKVKVDPRINEAEILLGELWSSAKLGDSLKESATQFMLDGLGKLRIYMPSKKFGTATTPLEAAKHVRVQFVTNGSSLILEEGGDKLSIVEISVVGKNSEKRYEISFVDDSGKTFIGSVLNEKPQINEEDIDEDEGLDEALDKVKEVATLSSPMNLDGNITVDAMVGKALVTETMLQNNRALNLVLSLGVGVLVEAGYVEMVTTNVAMKKREIADPNNPGETILVDEELERGATTLTNLMGEQTTDAQGNTVFQNPGVYWRNPTPLTSFVEGERLYYTQILAEAKQLFVLTTDDNIMSGESRIQARQDFLKKIQRYKPSLDVHGGWLLNTLMHFCASACGQDGHFDGISVLFDSKIYAGELSADEKNVVISQYEKELISRENAMVLLGTEDPLIEIDKIRQDQEEKLELQVRRLEATSKFGAMDENGRPKKNTADKIKTGEK